MQHGEVSSFTADSLGRVARWQVEWLVRTQGGVREVPGFSFLIMQPSAVRIQLLAIVDAVGMNGRALAGSTAPAVRAVAASAA
jgi:hypothetical protein